MKKFDFCQPTLGADVEMFLSRKGKHVGSEKVIPEAGIKSSGGKIICDGFQAELNPKASYCRELFADAVSQCVQELKNSVVRKGFQVELKTLTEVDKDEFDTLSNKSKEFGCNPDFDAHNGCATNKVTVNPMEDRHRSCGGHIHIGFDTNSQIKLENSIKPLCKDCEYFDLCDQEKYISQTISISQLIDGDILLRDLMNIDKLTDNKKEIIQKKIQKILGLSSLPDISKLKITPSNINEALNRPDLVIPMMDILVGIPSVLIDRDPDARIRRLVYGKAGCFRWQPHGLEYRTLSNFWLRSYWLMSLIMGQARLAFLIVMNDMKNKDSYFQDLFYEALKKNKISLIDVTSAINNNDFDMARKIFKVIEPILSQFGVAQQNNNNYPLTSYNDGVGLRFFKQIVVDGYERYLRNFFVEWDWDNGRNPGWETYASRNVNWDRNIEEDFNTIEKE